MLNLDTQFLYAYAIRDVVEGHTPPYLIEVSDKDGNVVEVLYAFSALEAKCIAFEVYTGKADVADAAVYRVFDNDIRHMVWVAQFSDDEVFPLDIPDEVYTDGHFLFEKPRQGRFGFNDAVDAYLIIDKDMYEYMHEEGFSCGYLLQDCVAEGWAELGWQVGVADDFGWLSQATVFTQDSDFNDDLNTDDWAPPYRLAPDGALYTDFEYYMTQGTVWHKALDMQPTRVLRLGWSS